MNNKLINHHPHPEYGQNVYVVTHKSNGKHIGDIYTEVDGYYVFQPIGNGGCWPGEILLEIGNTIVELNKEWDNHVKNTLKDQ